jgi:hypothetical protein
MEEPDVTAAFEDEDIGKLLKAEDRKTLSNFLYHLKSRRKKEDEDEAKKTEQERIISEKGKLMVDQKTYDLHQALLMPMGEIERKQLIKDTVDTNLFLFLEYMEGY